MYTHSDAIGNAIQKYAAAERRAISDRKNMFRAGIYGVIWSMDGASSRTSYKIELEPYCRYELGELYGRRGTNV